jgi:HK97 family phage prohead protease
MIAIRTITKRLSKGRLTGVDEGSRTATFCLTSPTVDRDGDRVDVSGVDYSGYMARNPVILFDHDQESLPIGKMVEIFEGTTDEGEPALFGKMQFSEANPQADIAWKMICENTLRACSISFVPKNGGRPNNHGGRDYDSIELLEVSVVPIGSNPDAVLLSKRLKSLRPRKSLNCRRRVWLNPNKRKARLLAKDGSLSQEMRAYMRRLGYDEVDLKRKEPKGEDWSERWLTRGEYDPDAAANAMRRPDQYNEVTAAYEEGILAARNGEHVSDNPYSIGGTRQTAAWERGWYDGSGDQKHSTGPRPPSLEDGATREVNDAIARGDPLAVACAPRRKLADYDEGHQQMTEREFLYLLGKRLDEEDHLSDEDLEKVLDRLEGIDDRLKEIKGKAKARKKEWKRRFKR